MTTESTEGSTTAATEVSPNLPQSDTLLSSSDSLPSLPRVSLLDQVHSLLTDTTSTNETPAESSTTDEKPPPFWLERQLVVCVLLTRLDEDDLSQAWQIYGSRILEGFATSILLAAAPNNATDHGSENDNDANVILLQGYVRLVAQVTARLSPEVYPLEVGRHLWQVYQTILAEPLMALLLSSLSSSSSSSSSKQQQTQFSNWLPLMLDVWSSLEVLLVAHPSEAQALQLIPNLWKTYQTVSSSGETILTHAIHDTEKATREATENNDKQNKQQHEDLLIMGQTLNQILYNAGGGTSTTFDQYSIEAWHEQVLTIITQVVSGRGGEFNQFPAHQIPSLLEWLCHPPPSLDAALQSLWNEWLWSWISGRMTAMMHHDPHQNHSEPEEPSAPDAPFPNANLTSPRSLRKKDALSYYLLRDNPQTVANLQQLLLAHVISPGTSGSTGGEDHALRAMAWQTLVALVDRNGWDWMMVSETTDTKNENKLSQDSSRLGQSRLLCMWIRLASGEWRIQLQSHQSLCYQQLNQGRATASPSTSSSPAQSSSSTKDTSQKATSMVGLQATAVPIGVGCARVLQSIVQYCIRLANQPHLPMPLSGEALLHLRQSLEQALCTTIEYLSLVTAALAQDSNSRAASMVMMDPVVPRSSSKDDPTTSAFFQASLRLLGSLLVEVDIFSLLEKPVPVHLEDVDVLPVAAEDAALGAPRIILECLRDLLPIAEDASLLPGLVHILGEAEDDPSKKALVRPLLFESLLEYLEWYWQRDCIDDTVAWACSCVELWVHLSEQDNDLSHSVKADRRRLCLALLSWMQRVLQMMGSHHPSAKNSLSLALGCYMTLSKDRTEEPKEHETRVVFRALQWCEMR